MRVANTPVNKIIHKINGDTFTPISLFQRLMGPKKFLLESSFKHEDKGRYSYLGRDPIFEFISTVDGGEILYRDGKKEHFVGNPLKKLKQLLPTNIHETETNIPLISGGIGYVSYDIVRYFEEIGQTLKDPLAMPEIHLMFYEVMIVFDHLEQNIYLVGNSLTSETTKETLEAEIANLKMEISKEIVEEDVTPFLFSSFEPELTGEEYVEKVEQAKSYIRSGDIFQVVLSHRMKAEIKGNPFDLYRNLRNQNPSPYMYFIDFGTSIVTGTSPESLIKVQGGKVVTNPIAGTKPRGRTVEEDLEVERILKNDEKELAEHRMLVDLGRNDLGKVCEFGTINLDKYMAIEKYRHVMHLVSEVSGILCDDKTALDALASCLPAGTVSGAPKVRAMEIINELEVSKRGVYSGAVGYISANGDLDFALAIRTAVIKDGYAYIQAGAGIVYDSDPQQEYHETLNKLKTFLEVRNDITY